MNDQSTVRLVILFLGLVVLAVVGGAIFLAVDDKGLPGELIGLGGTALGALAGILSRTGTNEPQPVEIVNAPAEPVPVDPVPAKRAAKKRANP